MINAKKIKELNTIRKINLRNESIKLKKALDLSLLILLVRLKTWSLSFLCLFMQATR